MTKKHAAAYPIAMQYPNGERRFESGLTKREIFVAMALQGLLASGPHSAQDRLVLPRIAVEVADNLLAALGE